MPTLADTSLQMKGGENPMFGSDLCIPRNETVRPRYLQNRTLNFCFGNI
jgi:hypothetical protein